MRLSLKPGAQVRGLRPELLLGHMIVLEAFRDAGAAELVITEGTSGGHRRASQHYEGNALDYRSRNLTPVQTAAVLAACSVAFGIAGTAGGEGPEFDFILEAGAAPHFHLEFQPKHPAGVSGPAAV